jgi:hypothetical protein
LTFYTYFAVVDDGIYFIQKGRNLEFIDFASGSTRTITHVEKPWADGILVSPDRRWILVTLLDRRFNDMMLVENFH